MQDERLKGDRCKLPGVRTNDIWSGAAPCHFSFYLLSWTYGFELEEYEDHQQHNFVHCHFLIPHNAKKPPP